MAVVGPGAIQDNQADIKPTLDGASELEYITILNPLSDDFAVRVAQDIPVNMPFPIGKDTSGKVNQVTNTEADARQIYGLSLKNPDFQGRKHITNDTIIKSGQTINLKGNEAQVAVRQLTNEILQREGKKRLLSDPTLRQEVENRIIINRGSVQDLMDNGLKTTRKQIDDAITQSNEVNNEEEFPGLSEQPAPSNANGSIGTGDANTAQDKRSPGRPKKA